MWPFKRDRRLDELPVADLTFLYEQDGEPERRLKSDLTGLLRQNTGVGRAYLAKAINEGAETVMLCLATSADTPDLSLPPQIGKIFATIFGTKEHLDILFLVEDQEAQLTQVCKPFYTRSATH
jgi:hypothetical protein